MSRFLVNQQQGNLDPQRFSNELENESVFLAHEKVLKLLAAVKTFLYRVIHFASQQAADNVLEVVQSGVTKLLSDRCALPEVHTQTFV